MSKGVQGVLAVFAVVLCVCPKLPKHSDLGLYSYTRSLPTQRGRIMHFLPRLLLFSYGSPLDPPDQSVRMVHKTSRSYTRSYFFFDVQRVESMRLRTGMFPFFSSRSSPLSSPFPEEAEGTKKHHPFSLLQSCSDNSQSPPICLNL